MDVQKLWPERQQEKWPHVETQYCQPIRSKTSAWLRGDRQQARDALKGRKGGVPHTTQIPQRTFFTLPMSRYSKNLE